MLIWGVFETVANQLLWPWSSICPRCNPNRSLTEWLLHTFSKNCSFCWEPVEETTSNKVSPRCFIPSFTFLSLEWWNAIFGFYKWLTELLIVTDFHSFLTKPPETQSNFPFCRHSRAVHSQASFVFFYLSRSSTEHKKAWACQKCLLLCIFGPKWYNVGHLFFSQTTEEHCFDLAAEK